MITEHLKYIIVHLPKTKDWFEPDDCNYIYIKRADYVLRRLVEEKILESKVTGKAPYNLKTLYRKTAKYFEFIKI